MFSENLQRLQHKADKIGKLKQINSKELLQILAKCKQKEGLETEEIVALLDSTSIAENRQFILDFSSNYQRPFDNKILLLPPLYFSSICKNSCKYCDFTPNGYTLTNKEFTDEFNALIRMGYRSIELVSSQDPNLYIQSDDFQMDDQHYNIDRVLQYFEISKKILSKNGGGMLTSNIPPVDLNGFKKLRSAGLDCYLIWLETFDPDQYSKMHNPNEPKSDQAFRLDSLEKSLQAGIPHIAGAFLKGLSNWKKEEVILYELNKYLKIKFGSGFSIIGTPRLKGPFQNSKLVEKHIVPDEDYELNIALDRILYDGILWLQTRESFQTNLKLISKYGGGVILTLTSCTAPGGYSKAPSAKAQFPVFKQRLKDSVEELEKRGFEAIFDWDPSVLQSFQRKS